jgi:hypothetical protein
MAYIDGESLQERVAREGAQPIADVVRFGSQMAEALAYAHREGVLHRDITPGNILLADGNAYLADFGIARMFHDSTRARTTASGFVLGTPTYMSPEQASGELECDGRSDVYSLGCVLYEATAGTPPFRGATTQAVIAGHFGTPPPLVHEVRAGVPLELSDAIARAMKSAPEERFADAAEFGAVIAAAGPPDVVRSSRHRRRPLRLARVGATVVALLAAAVLGAGYVAGMRWTPLRARVNRLAMWRGLGLVERGEWARADTALRAIVERDPGNAPAHLWLAQNGALAATTALEPGDNWKAEVGLAEEGRTSLDTLERVRLAALRAYADGAHDVARERYRRLVAAEPARVTTRLALADADLNDDLVVRDTSSPSQWRFRGSYEGASRALRAAFDLRPKSPAMRRSAYDRLTRVLITRSRYRLGHGPPGSARAFAAFPALDGDTLAFVPYPLADIASGVAESRNATLPEALARNRETLRRVAANWVTDLPDDADAHRAYAGALAAAGVLTAARPNAPDAVSEIRLARRLARDARARLFTGAQEVRLLVAARRFGEARALADSLLVGANPRETDEFETLAALATLRGNAQRAVAFITMPSGGGQVRLTDGRLFTMPPTLSPVWSALEVYAAIGRPVDSIVALRDRLDSLIRRDVAQAMIPIVRTSVLMRPLTLAAPAAGAGILVDLDAGTSLIARLVHDVAAHDTAALRAGLRGVDTFRRTRDAASLSLDGALLYSWLRLVAGDTAGAERQMDTVLDQFRALADGPPTDMIGSALVVRLMRQRAEVAARRGQPGIALRWRAAGDTLWR